MARMPMLSAVIVLSLGVGIGVNTAVFSWIQLFVFNPLPGFVAAARCTSSSRAPRRGRTRAPRGRNTAISAND